MTIEIVHACPPGDEHLTPCCGQNPFELPRADRMTNDPELVTCGRTVEREPIWMTVAAALAINSIPVESVDIPGLLADMLREREADATNLAAARAENAQLREAVNRAHGEPIDEVYMVDGLATVTAELYRRKAVIEQARRWVETCVDPVAVGAMRKQAMLDYLDGKRDVPDFEQIEGP